MIICNLVYATTTTFYLHLQKIITKDNLATHNKWKLFLTSAIGQGQNVLHKTPYLVYHIL